MLKLILLVVVVLIAGILVFAATRPDTFRTQRTTSINAPPEKIYPLIADFHRWSAWSPYEKLDPAMRRTISGAPSGTGAVYEWEGNSKAGQGRMEIKEATPSRIAIDLHFMKPFEANHTAEFTLEPQGDSTRVTWAMYGRRPYMMKVMSLFMSMDNMIGRDFESGLASLKTLAEQ